MYSAQSEQCNTSALGPNQETHGLKQRLAALKHCTIASSCFVRPGAVVFVTKLGRLASLFRLIT